MVVGRRSFPFRKVTFQGRTVSFREGIFLFISWERYSWLEGNEPTIYLNKRGIHGYHAASRVRTRTRKFAEVCLPRLGVQNPIVPKIHTTQLGVMSNDILDCKKYSSPTSIKAC